MKAIQVFNYSIKNSADNTKLEVFIDGAILDAETQQLYRDWFGDTTSVSFKSIRDQINAVENLQEVKFLINSPGGYVGDAMAIADLQDDLKNRGVKVKAKGYGLVASAATYPFLNADEVELAENAFLMIHPVSGGIYGNVNEIENYARNMRTYNDKIVDFYVKHSNLSAEQITDFMNQEKHFTAQECRDYGFINSTAPKESSKNKVDGALWNIGNKALLNLVNSQVAEPAPAKKVSAKSLQNTLLKNFQAEFMKLKTALVDALTGARNDAATDTVPNKSDVLNMVETVLTPFADAIDAAVQTANDQHAEVMNKLNEGGTASNDTATTTTTTTTTATNGTEGTATATTTTEEVTEVVTEETPVVDAATQAQIADLQTKLSALTNSLAAKVTKPGNTGTAAAKKNMTGISIEYAD